MRKLTAIDFQSQLKARLRQTILETPVGGCRNETTGNGLLAIH
jgi:hypothetical protein